MEGLVSFLHKIKNQKLRTSCFRCFSKKSTQTRNYNKLIGGAPGSSLRRARSHHSQPPAATAVADHLAALELAHSRSLRMNSVDASKLSYFTYGSRRVHSGTYEVSRESGGNASRRLHQNRA